MNNEKGPYGNHCLGGHHCPPGSRGDHWCGRCRRDGRRRHDGGPADLSEHWRPVHVGCRDCRQRCQYRQRRCGHLQRRLARPSRAPLFSTVVWKSLCESMSMVEQASRRPTGSSPRSAGPSVRFASATRIPLPTRCRRLRPMPRTSMASTRHSGPGALSGHWHSTFAGLGMSRGIPAVLLAGDQRLSSLARHMRRRPVQTWTQAACILQEGNDAWSVGARYDGAFGDTGVTFAAGMASTGYPDDGGHGF